MSVVSLGLSRKAAGSIGLRPEMWTLGYSASSTREKRPRSIGSGGSQIDADDSTELLSASSERRSSRALRADSLDDRAVGVGA